MKSYKELTQEDVYRIINTAYPQKALPFMSKEDVPNNWLKRNGYAMRRRKSLS